MNNNTGRGGWFLLFFLMVLAMTNAEFVPLLMLLIALFVARVALSNTGPALIQQVIDNLRLFFDDISGETQRRETERHREELRRRQSGYRRADDSYVDRPYQGQRPAPASAPPPRPRRSTTVYQHALDAVRAAGKNPDDLPVLPVDVGVLVFSQGRREPVIVRDWEVLDDADYVQPYIQIRLPEEAEGSIRFELRDSRGDVVYVHSDEYAFQRGRNLVIPSTRLPLHDQQHKDGRWELRVRADGMEIARHTVIWQDADKASTSFREHLTHDGELSSEIRAALAESRLEEVSLDELLGSMDDDAGQASQRRS